MPIIDYPLLIHIDLFTLQDLGVRGLEAILDTNPQFRSLTNVFESFYRIESSGTLILYF